jgi:endonuclease G
LSGNDINDSRRGKTIPVVQTHTHPDLDFCILVLAHNTSVAPRRIAQNSTIADTKSATLVGFGTIDLNGSVGYGKKRKVMTPITTLDCTAPGEARRYGCVKGSEIVAGHRGLGKDSCRGDTGGPLYIQDAAGSYVFVRRAVVIPSVATVASMCESICVLIGLSR